MNLGIIITGTKDGARIELVSDELQQDLVFTSTIAGQKGEILFSHKGEPVGIATDKLFASFVAGGQTGKEYLAYMLMRAFSAMQPTGDSKTEQIEAALYKVVERDKSDGVSAVALVIRRPELIEYLHQLANPTN